VAFNISGAAFIGRELFSPVVRTETRYEFTDSVNMVAGNHTMKFGGDVAFVNIPEAIFELNFAGLFNFGGLSASTLNPAFAGLPPFTSVQQYGLGFPTNYVQGFGNPISSISNKPLAFFAQDSWKIRPNITINYGVRYDYEITEQVATQGFRDPLSGITLSASDVLAAQDAMGVQQGFPRDKNNWAPRLAVAWDPRTTVRPSSVAPSAFSTTIRCWRLPSTPTSQMPSNSKQGILVPGLPTQTALLNAVQVFQGTVCVPGGPVTPICPAGVVTPGVAPGSIYQFGRQRFDDQTFPGFGPVLPFTLHVQKDFEYAYANQGNFTVERQLTKDMSLSGSYIFVGAHHLPHPLDVNAPRTDLQIANFRRYANRDPANTTEVALATAGLFPTTAPGTVFANPLLTGDNLVVIVPGMIVLSPTRGRIISPAIANFFRPNAPNYFLAQAASDWSCYTRRTEFTTARHLENSRGDFSIRFDQRSDF
jgi:hypothetical protein